MAHDERQSSIFEVVASDKKETAYRWELRVDGASRGNPGTAGAGIYILHDGKERVKTGFLLGTRTNNEAEYLALLVGLLLLNKESSDTHGLTVISDSQLLIKQMQGEYRVRKPELERMHAAIRAQLGTRPCQFKHVMREDNEIADALANEGIDVKRSLPLKILAILGAYEIPV